MLRIICSLLLTSLIVTAEVPIRDGLVMWLDASQRDSLTLTEGNKVSQWKSRVGETTVTSAKTKPILRANGLGGKPVVEFKSGALMHSLGALAGKNEVTVFVVFQRPKREKKYQQWRKVLTNGIGTKGICLDLELNDGEIKTKVLRGGFRQNVGADLWLGSSNPGDWGGLDGDIAEVLIYDRTFYVEEPFAQIVNYLEKKWNFKEDRSSDWTHSGPLPKTPKRLNNAFPLSDQNNIGQWQRHDEMWDEFDSEKLDHSKWWDHNPTWYGRAPARYLAREVQVKDGQLHLSMRKDTSLPVEKFYGKKEYRDYSSGSLKSKKQTVYGYFEIMAQAMPSAASSAWWFDGTSYDLQEKGRQRIEIDVFEIGARSKGHEHSYNMNAHVFRTPKSKRHWNRGGTWEAPFKFDEGFHIYGLEWTPEFIRYYVDGTLVRSLKNTHWHAPMSMIFDSETMFDWLGKPKDEDLPSTFRVKYVRAWKNMITQTKWQKRYRVLGNHIHKPSRATNYVEKMRK